MAGFFDTNKKFRVRTGSISSSKVQERELRAKAKKLAKDPGLIIPKCRGKCFGCPFKTIEKKIRSIQKYSDNLKKLKSASKRGNKVARAYAGTLMLAHKEFTPFMKLFKTPSGQIPFAIVGQNDPRKLIGIQHFDNQEYRLMTFMDLAIKKKIYIFSVKDGMVCTGSVMAPPEGFIKDCVDRLKVKLRPSKKGYIYLTKNLRPKLIKNSKQTRVPYMELVWTPAKTTFALDEVTLRGTKTHTMATLTGLVAGPNIKDGFSVKVKYLPQCAEKSDDCTLLDLHPDLQEHYGEYKDFKSIDHQLIKKSYEDILEAYSDSERNILLYDGYCFTSNIKGFLDHVGVKGSVRTALEAVLKRVKTPKIYKKKESPLNILHNHWKDYGYWALFAVCKDKKVAKELHTEDDVSTTSIVDHLEEAKKSVRSISILKEFPEFSSKDLPEPIIIADKTAKLFKSRGKNAAVNYLGGLSPKDNQSHGTIYAFLLALSSTSGREWKFQESQRDVGEFLKPFAKELLEAGPENYTEKLQTFSRYTGSTVEVVSL